jgi:hypothetical protein
VFQCMTVDKGGSSLGVPPNSSRIYKTVTLLFRIFPKLLLIHSLSVNNFLFLL